MQLKKRVLAMLLCLVMIAGQVGMTTMDAEDHGHDHELTEDTSEPIGSPVAAEQSASNTELSDDTGTEEQETGSEKTPAPEETTGPVEEPKETDEPEVTQSPAPGTDPESTEEPDPTEQGEPTKEPEKTGEPEPTGTPEAEPVESTAAPEATQEPKPADPGVDGPGVEEPAGSAPVISLEVSSGGNLGKMYFCKPPVITVTDEDGDLVSVQVKQGGEVVASGETTGEQCTLTFEGTGTYTITAVDKKGHEVTHNVYISHLLGGREDTVVPPTCTESGKKGTIYLCQMCGEYYIPYALGEDKNNPPLGHDMGEPETVEVCGESEAVQVWTCQRCGKQFLDAEGEQEYTPTGDTHQWVEVVVPAECNKKGYSCQRCEKCQSIRDYKEIPALVHQWEWKNIPGESCEKPGKRVQICKACGAEGRSIVLAAEHTNVYMVLDENNEYKAQIAEKGHWDTAWDEVDRCTEAGYAGYVCTKCFTVTNARKDSSKAPALGHNYEETHDCTQQSICTRCGATVGGGQHDWGGYQTDGDKHWRACRNKGCTVTQESEHTFSDMADNCTVDRVCTVCGYRVKAVATQHDLVDRSDETHHWRECQREGCNYVENKQTHVLRDDKNCKTELKCEVCGKVIYEAEAEHNWSAWKSSNYANHYRSCQNPGCAATERADHTPEADDHNCFTSVRCSVCHTVMTPGSQHNFYYSPVKGDEQGHYKECANAGCEQIQRLTGGHTGGTATCRDLAVCDLCGMSYGEKNLAVHVGGERVENHKDATLDAPGYTGDRICNGCGAVLEKGVEIPKLEPEHEHEYTVEKNDVTNHWRECECGDIEPGSMVPHELEMVVNGDTHYARCKNGCGYQTEPVAHVPNADEVDNDCTTPVHCLYCGAETTPAMEHSFDSAWITDGDSHWHICTNDNCEATDARETHHAVDDGDCTTALVCESCGHVMAEAMTHSWSTDVKGAGSNGHWFACENENCTQINLAPHDPEKDDGLCTTSILCTVCRYEITQAEKDHELSGYVEGGETGHWRVCLRDGCTYKTSEEPHAGGTAYCDAPAICLVCGMSYGDKAPENHRPDCEEIRDQVNPTTEKEGYTGDVYCTACEQLLRKGELLPKLSDEQAHDHDFIDGVYSFDSTHHWIECANGCGTRQEGSEEEHTFGPWQHDGTGHYKACTVCHFVSASESHVLHWVYSAAGHWQECDCGYRTATEEHVLTQNHDSTGHWQVCSCGYETEAEEHELAQKYDETGHWQACDCGYKTEAEDHTLSGKYDETGHWQACGCGYETEKAAHSGGTAYCDAAKVCEGCGQSYGEKDPANHVPGCEEVRGQVNPTTEKEGYTGDKYCTACGQMTEKGETLPKLTEEQTHSHKFESYSHDSTHHWIECANGCGTRQEGSEGEHVFGAWQHDEAGHYRVCTVCGYKTESESHELAQKYDEAGHWQECDCGYKTDKAEHELAQKYDETGHWQACGCGYETEKAAHSGGTAYCDAAKVCEGCGQSYGEKDSANHVPGCEEVRGQVNPTTESEGYTGDKYCTACGQMTEKGETLPKLTEEQTHSHKFEGYSHDSTHHWIECANGCGTRQEGSEGEHVFGAWQHDETGHYKVCTVCGYKTESESHELAQKYDEAGHWQECACGYKTDKAEHTLAQKYDESGHWQECAGCEYKTGVKNHVLEENFDESSHRLVCADCEYITGEAEHVFTQLYDESGHWQVCDCGYETESKAHTLKEEKSETQHWQACDCGYTANKATHEFAQKYDESGHWRACDCGYETEAEAHELTQKYGESGHWQACDCGYTANKATHELTQRYDESGHWQACDCGYETEAEAHELTQKYGESGHWQTCECGYETEAEAHELTQKYGESGHWRACDCGYETEAEAHELTQKYDESGHWQACDCGYETEAEAHEFSQKYDESGHWQACDCGYKTEAEEHTLRWEKDEEQHWQVCDCGYETEKAEHAAAADAKWESDETSHWHECEDCGQIVDSAEHTYKGRTCETCGYVDPNFVLDVSGSAPGAADPAGAAAELEAVVKGLVEQGGSLSEKVLEAADAGKDITVELVVTPAGQTASSKTVEIDIVVMADGEMIDTIDHTNSPITFVVSLDGLTGRIIRVLRQHNGSVSVIASSVSGGAVTFSSDLFSTFTIEASNDIGDATVDAIADQTYTGEQIKPAVKVTINGDETLTEGTDYTVSYSGNVEAGTATVTITGIGDFAGTTKTVTFRIVKSESGGSGAQEPRAPRTGDEAHAALWSAVLALCSGGLIALLPRKRREN